MEALGLVRVQAQIKLVFPAEFKARLAQGIVADLCARVALGQVCRVSGQLVGDDAFFDVIFIGQAQMLFRRHIAEHGAAIPANLRGANRRGDVVVAGGDVGGQRAKGVERRFVAPFQFFVHILFDQLHRHMAGAFDHHLHIVLPGNLGELAQGFQLAQLGVVVGVVNRARTQAIAQAEGHIVGLHDLADFLKVGVEEVFLMVGQTPFGHDRAAPADNAGHALGSHRHIAQQHTSMDGEVIHALFGLLDQRVFEDFPGQVFGLAADFFQRLINRHRANRHRAVADDPLAGFMDVFAGGQIHDGVGAPADAPGHFFDFFANAGSHRAIADIAVDLHQEVAADDHRLGFRVVDIGRDDGAATGDFVADEFRGDFFRNAGAKALAGVLAGEQARHFFALRAAGLQAGQVFTATQVFPNRHIFHFGSDDATAGVMHLADIGPGLGAARRAGKVKAQRVELFVGGALAAVFAGQIRQQLGVLALFNPGGAQRSQARAHVDAHGRVGVRAGGVVHGNRRVGFAAK